MFFTLTLSIRFLWPGRFKTIQYYTGRILREKQGVKYVGVGGCGEEIVLSTRKSEVDTRINSEPADCCTTTTISGALTSTAEYDVSCFTATTHTRTHTRPVFTRDSAVTYAHRVNWRVYWSNKRAKQV